MESPIVLTAYYVQNMIQLVGPKKTAKILDNLTGEPLFSHVVDNLDQLAKKVAKDGKKVSTLKYISKGFVAVEKGGKFAFDKTKTVVKKMGTKTVVGLIGKKVPVLSIGVGAGMALSRILENPHSEEVWMKAGAEVASGTAACFPGIGTTMSFTIDGILIASDLEDTVGNTEKVSTNKKHIPSLYTFLMHGNDVCRIRKLDSRFRIPANFELCFFRNDNDSLATYTQVDVLFYCLLSKEAAHIKANYCELVSVANISETLCEGEYCNDYEISLINVGESAKEKSDDFVDKQALETEPCDESNYNMPVESADKSDNVTNNVLTKDDTDETFYMGLTKWTPNLERNLHLTLSPSMTIANAIDKESPLSPHTDIEAQTFRKEMISTDKETNNEHHFYLLSQIICDLGRRENANQKCVLLFLCNRSNIFTDSPNFIIRTEAAKLWNERIAQLIPSVPTQSS